MRYYSVPATDIDAELEASWLDLQSQHDDLASPFFSPGFTHAASQCRKDVFVGVIADNDGVLGLLPFHRKPGGIASPVGGHYSDYHSIIGAPPGLAAVPDMLSGFRLNCFDYNHALNAQELFESNAFWHSHSPRVDLCAGYTAWYDSVAAKSRSFKDLTRKENKATREIGPVRFVANDTCEQSWAKFVEWKNEALRKKGLPGFPANAWLNHLIEVLRSMQGPDLYGCFSTLYLGDRLCAAHFGMRNARAWHWWFPSYDPQLSAYSPGLILLQRCILQASRMGCTELDLGCGTERYKKTFSNNKRDLCEGSLERLSIIGATRTGRKLAQKMANAALPKLYADVFRRGTTKAMRAGLV